MIKTFYFNDLATLSPPYGDGIGRIKSLSRLQQFSPPYGDGIKNVKTTELATLFSPPCGDCTLCTKFYHAPAEFSPPCGDGTEEDMTPDEFAEFSPPYGDGITFPVLRVCSLLFSPPYGDGILNISQNTAKLKSRMARKYSLYYNDVPLHCKERSQIHSACLVRGAVSWYDADNGSYKKECCPVLKTYITTVPLQGKLDPMLYQRERADTPTATCFPIVQVMRDTLEPGDTVQLLAIRQENADTARNYQRLLEELAQCRKSGASAPPARGSAPGNADRLVPGSGRRPAAGHPGVCLYHLRLQEHPGGHVDVIDLCRSYPYGARSRRCVLW